MGYNVTVVKGKTQRLVPCSHIEVTRLVEDRPRETVDDLPGDIGLKIQLLPDNVVVYVPSKDVVDYSDPEHPEHESWMQAIDADVVYVTNEQGRTINTYRPPKSEQEA